MSDITPSLEKISDLSVQSRAKGALGGVFLVNWMARAGALVNPWWSTARDRDLRDFWKKSDHLSGAIYTMEARMTAIPIKIVAKDQSVKEHVRTAIRATENLYDSADFYEGWVKFFGKFIEDLVSTDNGAFAEVIGAGPKDGPIVGAPVSVAHLDSRCCQRTGDPMYPVIYHDPISGRSYKLHFSRVLFTSQMSSADSSMLGVGFCAVSRCINVAQTLIDILTYKMEKLGSRPHKGIIITKGGLDPSDIQTAFQMAEGAMDDAGLATYSKVVVGGSSSLPEAGIDLVELSKLPDGFNEDTSILYGMAAIALAFGIDARELFPAMSSGATRADALLQHLKQRGKGPGQIIQDIERLFNFKYLPNYLEMQFDYQDDAQDRQQAEIKRIRADRRRQDASTKTMDTRTLRQQMLDDGDMTDDQFEALELADGRLEDGTSVLALFYSEDPQVTQYLDLGVDDPLDIVGNSSEVAPSAKETEENPQEDPTEMILIEIRELVAECNRVMVNTRKPDEFKAARKAFYALLKLEDVYLKGVQNPFTPTNPVIEAARSQAEAQMLTGMAPQPPPGKNGRPASGAQPVNKLRTVGPTQPNDNSTSGSREQLATARESNASS